MCYLRTSLPLLSEQRVSMVLQLNEHDLVFDAAECTIRSIHIVLQTDFRFEFCAVDPLILRDSEG